MMQRCVKTKEQDAKICARKRDGGPCYPKLNNAQGNAQKMKQMQEVVEYTEPDHAADEASLSTPVFFFLFSSSISFSLGCIGAYLDFLLNVEP